MKATSEYEFYGIERELILESLGHSIKLYNNAINRLQVKNFDLNDLQSFRSKLRSLEKLKRKIDL